MIKLDGATFLLQWATGGLLFTWVTTRRREVGLGFGWMMRSVYAVMLLGSVLLSVLVLDSVVVRDIAAGGALIATLVAMGVSILRRSAGVQGQRETEERRSARVAAMTGIDRDEQHFDKNAAEFPPTLDLIAPALGLIGLVAAGVDGSPAWLSVLRLLSGAAFLGSVTNAMLLGHWYLVQPGLARGPLLELVRTTMWLWPVEVISLLIPVGMISVLNGTIDDHYGGILGWMWVTCAITTLGLLVVTRMALKERQYSAVMAATGLLYLAILTAFGMDLVGRAVLA